MPPALVPPAERSAGRRAVRGARDFAPGGVAVDLGAQALVFQAEGADFPARIGAVNAPPPFTITLPPTPSGRFPVTVVTPTNANAIARVVAFGRNAMDGTSVIDIEIHDATTGDFVDSDFSFISIDRS